MHNAPSVLYPVGRSAFYGCLLCLLAVLGAGLLVVWWRLDAAGRWWLAAMGAALWACWLIFAWRSWQHAPSGHLVWRPSRERGPEKRSGAWYWLSEVSPEGAPILRVELMLDLQGSVLLRLHNADALVRWMWLARDRDPARWDDMRRALMASQA